MMRHWFEFKRLSCPPTPARPSPGRAGRIDRVLHRLATAALLAPIFVAPWLTGGERPLAQCAMAVLTLLAILGLSIQAWRRPGKTVWTLTPIHLLLAAAVALVAFQVTPLPGGLLRWLSPSLADMLPLWFGAEDAVAPGWGRWTTISVAPAATRSGLTMLLLYAALFVAAVAEIRSVECVERALRAVSVAVVLVALGSLLDRVFGERHFAGASDPLKRGAIESFFGPFREPTHLAHFLALGVGPLACLTFAAIRAHREARRAVGPKAARDVVATGWRLWWRGLAVAVVFVAAALGGSVGDAAVISLALTIASVLLWRSRLLGPRTLAAAAAVALSLVVASALRQWEAGSRSVDRPPQIVIDKHTHRAPAQCSLAIDLNTFRDFWPLGAGVNTFDEVSPRYCAEGACACRPHAANDYVQIALDTGLAGLALLSIVVAWGGWRCYRMLTAAGVAARTQACAASVVASLAVSLTQASFDCVWHVPAVMAATTILAACAARLADFTLPALTRVWRFEPGRAYVALGVMALVALGGWTIQQRVRIALAAPHWAAFELDAVADLDTRAQLPDRLVAQQLRLVLNVTPDDAHAHLQLAEALLVKVSEPLAESLRQRCIRWGLEHSRAAVDLSPLAGEGYVYLAEFQRFDSGSTAAAPALIRQALLTRPHHCEVLMAAGAERAQAGDLTRAVGYWREVFRSGPDEQSRVVPLLVEHRAPVDVILNEFQPDLDATRLLDAKYTPLLSAEDARTLLEYYLSSAETAAATAGPENAASLWVEIEGLYERQGKPDAALRCLRRAAANRPSNLELRVALGQRLLREHEYAEAEMHFKWCLQRRPDDMRLQSLLEETQQMLQADGTTAVRPPRRFSR